MIKLDSITADFPAFGALVFGFVAFYLLSTVLAGHAVIMRRIPWCGIHPLIKGDTMMSSMLYNVIMLMLSGLAVVQFCTQIFSTYGSGSSIVIMFNVLVMHLKGLYWFYKYATWAYLGCAVIGVPLCIVLITCCRRDTEYEDNLHMILKDARMEKVHLHSSSTNSVSHA
jgi:hypothetical protein